MNPTAPTAVPSPHRPGPPHRGRSVHWAALVLCFWGPAALAQPSIYSCTDGRGRNINSDRPIADCLDREQRELNPSGSLKRVVPPAYTAEERARLEAQKRAEAETLAQRAEKRRQEQVLLARHPHQEAHDQARAEALRGIGEAIALARQREQELDRQRQSISDEMEFYRRDPSKAPEWLKSRQAHNSQQRMAMTQYLSDQEAETARLNTRFDQELDTLRRLWAQAAGR